MKKPAEREPGGLGRHFYQCQFGTLYRSQVSSQATTIDCKIMSRELRAVFSIGANTLLTVRK